jgi:hypothetical protein
VTFRTRQFWCSCAQSANGRFLTPIAFVENDWIKIDAFLACSCHKDFTKKLTLLFYHEAIPDSASWAHGPELTSLRSALTPKGCGTEDRPKRLLKAEPFQDLSPTWQHVHLMSRPFTGRPTVQASCLWSRPQGLVSTCLQIIACWCLVYPYPPPPGTYLPVPVESVCSQNDRQPWGSSVRLPIYILAKSCRAPLETTSCRNGSRDSAFWPQESRAFRSHETVKPLCRNPTRYRPGLCLQIAHLLLGCLRSSEWLAVDQMLVALVYYEAQLVIWGITARSQPGNWIVYYSWPIFSHGPSLRCCVYI